jgi:hypothetical protein
LGPESFNGWLGPKRFAESFIVTHISVGDGGAQNHKVGYSASIAAAEEFISTSSR